MEPDRPQFRNGLPMRLFGWVQVKANRLSFKKHSRFVKLNGEVMSLHASEHALPLEEFDVFAALVEYTNNPSRKDFKLTIGRRILNFTFGSYDEMLTWAQSIQFAAERDFSEYYTLGVRIGEGTYSKVYLAHDNVNTNLTFAVKVIQKKHRHADFELKKWIERERHVNTVVSHRCVVQAVDMFCTLDYVHIVFEYMAGGTVRNLLNEHKRLGESYARVIMRELLTALQYIHSKNIVHRDIRPDNLFCSDTKFPMVIALGDFGFSNFISDKIVNCEVLSTIMGILPYTAIEICREQKYGPNVDLWSAGVLLYELLCGKPPFVGCNNHDTNKNICRGLVTFHDPIWNKISPAAKGLILQLLCVDSHRRISALAALQHAWFGNSGSNLAGARGSARTPLITPSESSRMLVDRRDDLMDRRDEIAQLGRSEEEGVSSSSSGGSSKEDGESMPRERAFPRSTTSRGSKREQGFFSRVPSNASSTISQEVVRRGVGSGQLNKRASAPVSGNSASLMRRSVSHSGSAFNGSSPSLQYTASLSSLSGVSAGQSRMAMTPSILRIQSMGLQAATNDNPERMKVFLKSPVVKSQLASMFPLRRKLILWARVFIAVFRMRALAKGESLTRQLSKVGSSQGVDLGIAERRKKQAMKLAEIQKQRASSSPKLDVRPRVRHMRQKSREATSALFAKLSPSDGAKGGPGGMDEESREGTWE